MHFSAKVLEIRTSAVLFVEESVKRAVRAESLTEGDVGVEHIAVPLLGAWECAEPVVLGLEVALVEQSEGCGYHAFGEQGGS
jgi:hypothetical protein